MNTIRHSLIILLAIAFFGSVLLIGYTGYIYRQQQQKDHLEKHAIAQKSLENIVSFFEKKLTAIAAIALELDDSDILLKSSIPEIEKILQEKMETSDTITGMGIAFEPYAYNPEEQLLALHFTLDHAKEKIPLDVNKFYNYTKANWYTEALKNTKEWVGPYIEASMNATITRYAQALSIEDPVTHEKKIYGVLTIDTSIDHLNDALASLNIDKNSYAFITGKNGILIAHPNEHFIAESKTIFDLAQSPGQKDFITLGNAIKTTSEGEISLRDTRTYKKYNAFYKHIPGTKWTTVVVVPVQDELIPSSAIRRALTNLILSCLLSLFFMCALYATFSITMKRGLWITSIALSLVLGISTGMLWIFDSLSTERQEFHEHIVNNAMAVSRFFYLQKRLNPTIYKKDVHFIPTGLFIYAIDLPATSANVSLNGHIWQKYDLKKDSNVAHDIIILNAKEQTFEKIYEVKDSDTVTIGWRFKVSIKSNFNFTKYPFDQQNIVLILAHKDYKANIILTPDFEAFSSKATPHPEIDPITNTGQWTTKNTYSFYQLTDYVTDFGIEDYTKQKSFPNLCFNILVRRNFSDPLITNFLPILIIIVIAFMTMVLAGLTNERTKDIAALVLPLCSSIFFAAVIGHQTYERALEFSGVSYFEYFYFMLYVIILLTTINGMLYGYHRGGWLINYEKNFIPRLLYWPLVLTAFLINTLIFFY